MPNSESSPDDLIGKEIGPYTLVRRLGVGGMAEAYEAIRQGPSGFSQRVCLKLVLPFLRNDRDFIRLFEREARLAAQLRHRNIVGVIDFGQIDGRSYMALELIHGADLRVVLDHQPRRRLSTECVALLGLELADALEHAHGSRPSPSVPTTKTLAPGIVHRDISPSNVLVSRQGEIMLTDFGVAKAMSGASRHQSSVKGKVPYMSPEQLRAEPLDGRADLFAVGVVLFEALAGQRPYDGPHDPATIMRILNGDRPTLRALVPESPAKLCEVVDALLEPNRDDRPDSASTLIELLDPFASSALHRRVLGQLAVDSRDAADRAAVEISAVVADGATEPGIGPPIEDTGVKPAGSAAAVEAAGAAEPVTDRNAPGPEPTALSTNDSESWRTSAPELPLRGASRRKLTAAMAALVAVVGATAIGATLWRFDEGATPRSDPEARETTESRRATEGPVADPPDTASSAEPQGEPPSARTPAAAEPPSRQADIQLAPEPPAKPKAQPSQAKAAPAEKVTPPPPTKTKPAVARREPAKLSIVVFPWGNVWVNGERLGAAPIRNKTMKPGRYTIGVGENGPSKSRTVRLKPGDRRTVRFDLTP